MNRPNIPSVDPAQADSLEGLLEIAARKNGLATDGQLPCEVLSYNRTTNVATVRPLISVVATSGDITPRDQIAKVPVLALGGGGYTITFPLKRGDLGWIEASDRDISLFMQSMSDSPPNTWRIHNFSDGRFIPDSFAQYTFDEGDDAESMVLQSLDGTVKICLDPSKIRVIAPTVEVTSDVATIAASTSLTATVGASSIAMTPAAISLTSPAIALNQTGSGAGSTFTGAPVIMPDAIINGVQQSTHVHPVIAVGSDTGGPT